MRHLIAFMLILAGNFFSAFACGPYYPFGDAIRFTIFSPSNFRYNDFQIFNYSSQLFHPEDEDAQHSVTDVDDNILLWKEYCKNKVTESSIADAIYSLHPSEIKNKKSNNLMIKYLYDAKDTTAINYIFFAKQCEKFNKIYDDPWERNEPLTLSERTTLKNNALRNASSIKDESIQLRYAFLAIRLAFYNRDSLSLENVYQKFFSNRKRKNIIDSWSMYFWAMIKPNSAQRNFYLAQIFANTADKRFMASAAYDKSISINNTIRFAKNDDEIAGIWLLTGVKNHARALAEMQNVYAYQPNSKGLSFLLLREINKLEDWIYTPYYGYFFPSIESSSITEEKNYSLACSKRINSDREYAKELLRFIESIDINKTENPLLFKTTKAYLHFMTGDYTTSINEINLLQNKIGNKGKLYTQLQIIKALCLAANEPKGNAKISDQIKPILMQQYEKRNYRFIFAVARELEYKGNTTDAALLFSKINHDAGDEDVYEGKAGKKVYWRTKKNHHTLWLDYFDDYFFYLDAQYSSNQTEQLIHSILYNKKNDRFSIWKYSVAQKNISRLYDLLGTKYIRQNELQNALASFEKINDTLWTSSLYNYKYLDANPFFTNYYNEHSKTIADSIKFTKTTITERLINYLNRASDPKIKNRAYYYFLVANCYLNMTQYGNSWMMRRYYWTSNETKTNLEDDAEYFNCNLAKKYYLKANEVSKNKKFAALCLRMAGRCEAYKNYRGKSPTDNNTYFKQLKKEYPEYYEDLVSNCQSFDSYFLAKRKNVR